MVKGLNNKNRNKAKKFLSKRSGERADAGPRGFSGVNIVFTSQMAWLLMPRNSVKDAVIRSEPKMNDIGIYESKGVIANPFGTTNS